MSNQEKSKEYIKELKKFSNNLTYNKFIDSINSINLIDYSKKTNASSHLNLIHRFIHAPEVGYSVVCYRATKIALDSKDEKKHIHIESIYAFVYVEVEQTTKSIIVRPKYVCASPTFTSRDGEYRQRFIPFHQLLQAKNKYPELWAEAEEETLSKMAETYLADDIYDTYTIPVKGGVDASSIVSGDLIFHADVYPSTDDKDIADVLKKWANNSRMAIHLFIAAWLIDGRAIHDGIEENHINPNYKIIIYDGEDDKPFFDKWTGSSELKIQLNRCRYILSFIQTNPDYETQSLKIGQKLIPLSVGEVISTDIALGVWKEIILGMLCSNLVINGIAPGFAISGPWFFLEGVDSGIYDNVAMHEKFNFKNEIIKIDQLLKDAQTKVWKDGNAGSADLDSLAKQINETLRYSIGYITTTDISIVSLSEWVGQTIRDIPRIYRNKRLIKANVPWAETHTFDHNEIFTKYIFDWIYGCHAMNYKLKFFHGDLHLNNITINQYIDLVQIVDGIQEFKTGPNPHSLYIITGKEFSPSDDMYIFESYGFCGAVIDYSRALIADLEIIRKIDPALLADDVYVQKRQQEGLLRILHKNFPDIVEKHEIKIKALIFEKFELMMKIAYGIDPFNICDNVHLLLAAEFPNTFKKLRGPLDHMRAFPVPEERDLTPEEEGVLDPAIPKLLADVRDFAREFVVSNLIRAVNGNIEFPEDLAFVGDEIIRKFFKKFTIGARQEDPNGLKIADSSVLLNGAPLNIYDVFNFSNPMKYSAFKTSEFETPPEVLQTTIKSDKTKEFHRQQITEYLKKVKRMPEVAGKMETLRSHFKSVDKLPIDSLWKYDRI